MIRYFFNKWRVARFIVTGGTAFCVHLAFLYMLTDLFGMWYIFSATLAFVVSLLVGFSLNKFWTFTDFSADFIHGQLFIYLGINLLNLTINNLVLYVLVESFGVWYILAQAIASVLIAFESFFLYKRLFKSKGSEIPISL